MPCASFPPSALRLSPSPLVGGHARWYLDRADADHQAVYPTAGGQARRRPARGSLTGEAIDTGGRIIPDDLFAKARLEPAGKPLTVFRAELTGREEAGWEDLFAGFTALKAITFSSSIELLLRLSERLDNMEVVFGSESILSKEHLALAQASQTIEAYGFADALIDHKALVEALSRLLGRTGKGLLGPVVPGALP